jgi:hypothetical protein
LEGFLSKPQCIIRISSQFLIQMELVHFIRSETHFLREKEMTYFIWSLFQLFSYILVFPQHFFIFVTSLFVFYMATPHSGPLCRLSYV